MISAQTISGPWKGPDASDEELHNKYANYTKRELKRD